ncbi:MAG TPA: bifunctional precorrin-2 dehydrogenase/sirohydrochlorin ferrochelatase [Chitinophagales bacterium]|nr:bifunctional precorrin-2 dehydrogenase/sirohydrochlorin ferrochelatase [Chitinophagales bacterium]
MNNQNIPSKNFLFPVFLRLEQMRVLLVGAGPVGLEKATAILSNCPNIQLHIIAEVVSPEVRALPGNFSGVTITERRFNDDDLIGIQVLFLAINNKELSGVIYTKAHQLNILVNVADTPDFCDFYMSSIVQKGQLKLAISTNGQSPTMAKRLKEVLNDALPDELDDLIANLNQVRNGLKGDFADKVKQLNELTSSLKIKEGGNK